MTHTKILVTAGLVMGLALVAVGQTDMRPEGGPPQPPIMVGPAQPPLPGGPGVTYQVMAGPRPGPVGPGGPGATYQGMGDPRPGPVAPGGPGPMPLMRMREYAEQLRTSSREAQELADRLRRQADELDQFIMQQMNRRPGPQNMGRIQRESGELRQRADQLRGSMPALPAGPGMNGPEEMKRQIERLRAEAARAKQEGRVEDSERVWKEADRMEQQLREQGPRPKGQPGQPMSPDIQNILKAAEQAEREGRMDDARRMREKAEVIARQGQGFQQPGPRGDEVTGIKEKIERLRDESRKAKEQGRHDDANRMWQEADRLEQQLRGPGPGPKGAMGKPMPPEVQDILKAAEQAEREGRMDDARRQREKADAVARQGQMQQGPGPKQPGPQLKDDLKRSIDDLKKEIGRLWQAVNEMRSRPQDGRAT